MVETVGGEAVLRFESVSREFGAVRAVDGISVELRRGEILTLLGPSGCGKTTTLRMAIGLERASSGRIVYNGQAVDAPAEKVFVEPEHRGMGMVFQSYAIWPHMNVFENVAYPLKLRRVPKAEIARQVDEMLTQMGLSGLAQRRGTQLSGGQQQRVAVARGLIANPGVLLMDEPFSNLDARLREQMRVDLKRLQRRLGLSVLFVTHDQSEALALSDRIAVMKDGRIEQIGPPEALYSRPETPAVRDFLGRSILLPSRVETRHEDSLEISLLDGQRLVASGPNHSQARQPGDKCLLAVRPEYIFVNLVCDDNIGRANGSHLNSENGMNNGVTNEIQARIRTLLFLGEKYEAEIEFSGGHLAMINLTPARAWREGEAVRLSFPADKLQLWNREDAPLEHA